MCSSLMSRYLLFGIIVHNMKKITRSISLNTLYNEIGWSTLDDRRTYQKVVLTFKIKNTMVPDYLSDLFPRSVEINTT